MPQPETRLTGFTKYVTARPSARASAIREAVGGDYNVARDYYLQLRRAIQADRRTTRDSEAVRAAVTNAHERKAGRYRQLAARWQSVAPRWDDTEPTRIDRARIVVGGLGVTISPSFAETRPDGTLEIVTLRYTPPGLPNDVIDMLLRLVQRAYEPLHPDAAITFVDLDTANVRSTLNGADLSKFDTWIDTEGAGLAYALRNAA